MNTKSALIIGLPIIISCIILVGSNFLTPTSYAAQEGFTDRYSTIRINDAVWVITDKETGQCWANAFANEKDWIGRKLSQ